MSEISPLEITGRATIAHLNARKEGKGEQKVLAVDLKLAVTTDNDLLISFHPQLRLMLFTKEGSPRFKELGAVPWEREFHRMVLVLRSDLMEKPITFLGVKIHDFEFAAKEGGKVRAAFKAQLRPSEGELESLAKLLAEPCDLLVHNMNADLFVGNEAAAATTRPPSTEPAAAQPVVEPEPEPEPQPLGEFTEDLRKLIHDAGAREAAKHEDDRDFDTGKKAILAELKLSKDFIDEYLTEIDGAYTEGWETVPADV